MVKGSCGGLGVVGIEKVCNCFEFCDVCKKCEVKVVVCVECFVVWEKDWIV